VAAHQANSSRISHDVAAPTVRGDTPAKNDPIVDMTAVGPTLGERRSRSIDLPLGISWPALVGVVAVAGSYHYSLFTLGRGLSLQTPLAYLGLVPIGALLLLWISSARHPAPPLGRHDLPLDFVLGRALGIGLLATAIVIAVLLPTGLGPRFWLYRLDLLSMPFFVAGLIALLFGVRRLWTFKSSVLFLLLAWPVPYGMFLTSWLDAFTGATAQAVHAVSVLLSIGRLASPDGTVVVLDHGGSSFAVSIGSACSGVNGLVGFLLLGTALMLIVRGTALRRLVWLTVGLSIVWLLNIARIELVLVTGVTLGPEFAFDVLHPLAGLLVFNVGVLITLWLVPRIGLRFVELPDRRAHPETKQPLRLRQGLRTSVVVAIAIVIAAGVALVNASYSRYEQITGDLGTARLVRFDVRTAQIPGWSAAFVESVPQARQFFGADARWYRLIYTPTASAGLQSTAPIYVDVIDTDDAGALAAYTVADCYQFHHFRIDAQIAVDIGVGVTGQVVTYFEHRDRSDWSAISWEWPKQYDSKVRYERIVVFVPNSNAVRFAGFEESAPVAGDTAFHDTQRFLATVARNIVRAQVVAAAAVAGREPN